MMMPQSPTEERGSDWDPRYKEVSIGDDKPGDRGWREYMAGILEAINPAIGSIEAEIRRTPLTNPWAKKEADLLLDATTIQMSCGAAQWGLRLQSMETQRAAAMELINKFANETEDVYIPDLHKYFEDTAVDPVMIPPTLSGCRAYKDDLDKQIEDLRGKISKAQKDGVYYDIRPFLRWYLAFDGQRMREVPSAYLPPFGRILMNKLGVESNNTFLSHIEAVISRQIAEKFGGNREENEKTRDLDRRNGYRSNNES